ncbi:MAG: head GIN domain-containing protein [Bergeyella sp.]
MKKILTASLIAVSAMIFAQSSRNMGDFSKLKVYDRIQAELIPSDEARVEIIGNNDGDVETVNKNGELKIKMTAVKLLQGDGIKVKVYYSSLNDIQASQGAVITSSSPVESSMLGLTANEGSRISLEIETSKLNAKLNSGGEISVSGTAENQDIIVNSGGKFSGKKVDSQNAEVTANAGGEAEVYAEKSAKATTRAGGRIKIYGNPDDRDEKKIAGGTISFH